jgi:opine dehydrogenase
VRPFGPASGLAGPWQATDVRGCVRLACLARGAQVADQACETGIAEIQFLGLFIAASGGILRLSSTTDQRQQAQGMSQLKIGIAGCGAIGLASAAWMAERGHAVRLWSPRDPRPQATVNGALTCNGVLETTVQVTLVDSAMALARDVDVLLIAVPVNGHRAVMDALIPHLRSGLIVIVSSMGSLSSLYLYEAAKARGVAISVASFGTTVLTARRLDLMRVRIMTRRTSLGVSCLPRPDMERVLKTCKVLFGGDFTQDENVLATALTNINPIAHGPLALFNWTRIERAENWPQYHFMTPRVASVIEQLDMERLQVARAFGLQVRTIEQHFARSFDTRSARLQEIAEELHAKRGGPPGPTDVATRFLVEDVPYGLVFLQALSHVARVSVPATEATATMAALVTGIDFANDNDLLYPLRLPAESVASLLARVNAGQ